MCVVDKQAEQIDEQRDKIKRDSTNEINQNTFFHFHSSDFHNKSSVHGLFGLNIWNWKMASPISITVVHLMMK